MHLLKLDFDAEFVVAECLTHRDKYLWHHALHCLLNLRIADGKQGCVVVFHGRLQAFEASGKRYAFVGQSPNEGEPCGCKLLSVNWLFLCSFRYRGNRLGGCLFFLLSCSEVLEGNLWKLPGDSFFSGCGRP